MDRAASLKKRQGERLAEARKLAGFRSAREAALENGWPESSYRAHEGGTRTIGQDDAERYVKAFRLTAATRINGAQISAKGILFGSEEERAGPEKRDPKQAVIMGFIGAGATVEPDFEQVPQDGFGTVDLPFAVPDDIIALEVKGDSQYPAYEDGDVILVWKEQRRDTDSYLGEEVAVRTADGRRFLKRIERGGGRGLYNLESWNARSIASVRVEWVGEIYLTVKIGQLQRIRARERANTKARTSRRSKRTAGTDDLPLTGLR